MSKNEVVTVLCSDLHGVLAGLSALTASIDDLDVTDGHAFDLACLYQQRFLAKLDVLHALGLVESEAFASHKAFIASTMERFYNRFSAA